MCIPAGSVAAVVNAPVRPRITRYLDTLCASSQLMPTKKGSTIGPFSGVNEGQSYPVPRVDMDVTPSETKRKRISLHLLFKNSDVPLRYLAPTRFDLSMGDQTQRPTSYRPIKIADSSLPSTRVLLFPAGSIYCSKPDQDVICVWSEFTDTSLKER